MGKTRKISKRKAPAESATSLPEGSMKGGYVIKKYNGVPRWIPQVSAELNGFRLFTTDIAAKYIGKPISIYSREYKDAWPTKSSWTSKSDSTHLKYTFIPSGDAIKGKTRIEGWLKAQTPIKKGDRFAIEGPLYLGKDLLIQGLQVDSGGKILSDDLLGSEVFVKV